MIENINEKNSLVLLTLSLVDNRSYSLQTDDGINEWMLIVKDDVYKYKTYKRLMIKVNMDKYQTTKIKIEIRLARYWWIIDRAIKYYKNWNIEIRLASFI